MRNPQQINRLMKLSLKNRTFVMDALARIKYLIEEHLYNYDDGFEDGLCNSEGVDGKNAICINLKDIIYSVFETEKVGKNIVIKGWMSHPTRKVPEELYHKTWREIFKGTLFTRWGYLLEKELEAQGFSVVREQSDPKRCFLKIRWTEKEEKSEL